MCKTNRKRRLEKKIKETKSLRDQFMGQMPELQARIKILRQKLVDIYR